jgi:hypothetical protein
MVEPKSSNTMINLNLIYFIFFLFKFPHIHITKIVRFHFYLKNHIVVCIFFFWTTNLHIVNIIVNPYVDVMS